MTQPVRLVCGRSVASPWPVFRSLALSSDVGVGQVGITGLLDPTDEGPLGEPGADAVARPDVLRGAEGDLGVVGEGQAITSGEDGEGAEGLQSGGESGEAV